MKEKPQSQCCKNPSEHEQAILQVNIPASSGRHSGLRQTGTPEPRPRWGSPGGEIVFFFALFFISYFHFLSQALNLVHFLSGRCMKKQR